MALLIKHHRKKGSDLAENAFLWSGDKLSAKDHKANNEALYLIWEIIQGYNPIKGYAQQDIWHAALSIVYDHGLELAEIWENE